MSNIVKKKIGSRTIQQAKTAPVPNQKVTGVVDVLRQHIDDHSRLTDELHALIDRAQNIGEELEKMNDRTRNILRKVNLLKH